MDMALVEGNAIRITVEFIEDVNIIKDYCPQITNSYYNHITLFQPITK
jgi:hypothetical protein